MEGLFAGTMFLFVVVVLMSITFFLNHIVDPLYFLVFKKPVYVYFHPILKKLTPAQKRILETDVAFYRRLSDKKKKYFEHRLAGFLLTYTFHGKDGIVINDEIKITIASSYIMLTFGMRHYLINVFDKIIVYPETYYSTINGDLHKGEFNPRFKAIVFSWHHFKEGIAIDSDNLNLGIHEFAHALHGHGMKKSNSSAAIFTSMYDQIRKDIRRPANAKRLQESNYFRLYAFTNDFEFLAVILEHFFETPQTFRREFPELFLKVQRMINYTP